MPKRVAIDCDVVNGGRVTRSRVDKEEAPILNYCSSVLNFRPIEGGNVTIQFPGAIERGVGVGGVVGFVCREGAPMILIDGGRLEYTLEAEYLRHKKAFASWEFLLAVNKLERALTATDAKYIRHAVNVVVGGLDPSAFYKSVDRLLRRKRTAGNKKLFNNLQVAIGLSLSELEGAGSYHAKFRGELEALGEKLCEANCVEMLYQFTQIQTRYKNSLYLADTLADSFVSALTFGGVQKTLEQLAGEFMAWHSGNCGGSGAAGKVYKIIFDWKQSPSNIGDAEGDALWEAFTTRDLCARPHTGDLR